MKLVKKGSKTFCKIAYEEWLLIGRIAGFIRDIIYVDKRDDGQWDITGYSDGQDVFLGTYSEENAIKAVKRFRSSGYEVKINVKRKTEPEEEVATSPSPIIV